MLIREFRVILPMTVDEYEIAQLYSVAEASKNETGGGEGVEVLKNEQFNNYPLLGGKYKSGRYTHKIYHLGFKAPPFIRLLAPKGCLEIHEQAWNAYPYCRTIVSNPGYMKEKFLVTVESYHVDDRGNKDNIHELPPSKLREREVVIIDIGNDPVKPADYHHSEDPSIFVSKKTGRGPLTGDWISTVNPVMTCYKLVTCEFRWLGLQKRLESFIMKSEKRLFTIFHRQLFCWMDEWYGLTMKDIRSIEDKTKEDLDNQRLVGSVRGLRAKDND